MIELEAWSVASLLIGIATGIIARILLLRVDYRQYPSYPHNFLVHLTTGIIASVVGAIFLPALLNKEYTAVTFLVLAATQFREVRAVERETLSRLEDVLLVPRGSDYIEGIAGVFEARNYLVMAASVAASTVSVIGWLCTGKMVGVLVCGILTAALVLLGVSRLRSGGKVGDVARVQKAQLRFDGASLFVDDIYIKNVGSREMQEQILRWGKAYRIIPYSEPVLAKLSHPGQRQAIIHDVTAILGSRADVAMSELIPLIRQDVATGDLGVFVTPAISDDDAVMAVIRQVPLLESARPSAPGKFNAGGRRSAY